MNRPFHRTAPRLRAGLCAFAVASLIGAALIGAAPLPASAADGARSAATTTKAPRAKAVSPQASIVASAHALASEAGIEILGKGGNAFDAAVAVSAVLSVVEPISSGLGGGGFFLLHDARTGKDIFIDARETAPIAATPTRFLDANGGFDRDRATNGPWSAGIPGLPAGLVHLSKTYGKLPLKITLAPAIRIARDGFPVYARMSQGYAQRAAVMERYPGTRAVFLADGDALKEGEIFRQPDLARTLELLAEKGHDGFYRGETANELLAGVKAEGGEWTAEELAGYRVRERAPLRFEYDGWSVVTAPPPSSGGIALAQMLQILEPYDLAKLPPAQRVHLTVEAMRRAFRDRTFYLGDPDFVKIPMRTLASADYAAGLRAGIHPSKATPSDLLSGEQTPMEDEDTTHFSIIDRNGNRVAGTQTVNLLYGSGLIPPGTGVLLNNEMDDFALKPGTPNAFGVMGYDANAPKPGKRMLSSMTPTFMESNDRVAVLGTPGGSRIITMVLLGALGYADGLDAQSVAALPRYHHQWTPDAIGIERDALPDDVVAALRAMGHTVVSPKDNTDGRRSSDAWGNLQTVEWNKRSGDVRGGSDPRNPVGAVRRLPQKKD